MKIDHFYDSNKNIHWYHLRYTPGETYVKFYKWHSSRKLRYGYDDMPHDFWVYLNEQDRLEFHLTWSDCIDGMIKRNWDSDSWTDFTKPSDAEVKEIFKIFQECIQEEINRDILAKISKGGL